MEESVTRSPASTSSYRRRKVIRRVSVSRILSSSSSSPAEGQEWSFSFSSPAPKHTTPRQIYNTFNTVGSNHAKESLQQSVPRAVSQLNYSTATPVQKQERLQYIKNIQQQYNSVSYSRPSSILTVSRIQAGKSPKKPQHVKYDSSIHDDVLGLNRKLQRLVQENQQLDTQLRYVTDDEVHYKQVARVKALEKQLQEEKVKYQTVLKQVNRQQELQKDLVANKMNGVELAPELERARGEAAARVGEAAERLRQTEGQLREWKHREDTVLKYIPSHYYLIVKDVSNVERLVRHLKDRQRKAVEGAARSALQSQNLGNSDVGREIGSLARQIDEVKRQIGHERARHEEEMARLAKARAAEENNLIKLSSDYDLLLRELGRKIGGDGSFDVEEL